MLQRKDFLHITIFIWVSLFFITLFTTYTVVILFIPKIRGQAATEALYKDYPSRFGWLENTSHPSKAWTHPGANSSHLDVWDIAHFAKVNSPEEYDKILHHIRGSSSDADRDNNALKFSHMKDKMEDIRDFGTGNNKNTIYGVPDLERASAQVIESECQGRLYPDNLNVSDLSRLSTALPYLKNYANPCFCVSRGSVACLPLFYVLGAEQCALDVSRVLAAHPLIHSVQQADWWQRSRLSVPGAPPPVTLRQYMDDYKSASQHIQHTITTGSLVHPGLIGDSSPSMLYDQALLREASLNQVKTAQELQPDKTTAGLLHSLVPQAKLIVVLCDPAEHFYDQWQEHAKATSQNVSDTQLLRELNKALQLFRECLSDMDIPYSVCLYRTLDGTDQGSKPHWSTLNQLRAGLYYDLLQDWMAMFPRRQFHIVNYNDFRHNQTKVADDIFHFLELYDLEKVKVQEVIKELKYLHKERVTMGEDVRDFLKNFYESHNEVLAEFLRDLTFLWKDDKGNSLK